MKCEKQLDLKRYIQKRVSIGVPFDVEIDDRSVDELRFSG